MYTVIGATGNIGSVITHLLLAKGEKVRAVSRHSARLEPLVAKGAEACVAEVTDAEAMARAFTGARAAFLMIPPNMTSPDYRAEQIRISEAYASAAKSSGLQYAVHLSSFGAQSASGCGPISGLHHSEVKLDDLEKLNVLHLRAAYFMENHLQAIRMIQGMGVYGAALKPDLPIPMIATHDIGEYAAGRLLDLDFNGKQIQELLGPRDVTLNETTALLAKALNKPDLRYVQFPYDQVEQVFAQMGVPGKTTAMFTEMSQGLNSGLVSAQEPRSAANSTPTSIETFLQNVFVPAYQGRAASA